MSSSEFYIRQPLSASMTCLPGFVHTREYNVMTREYNVMKTGPNYIWRPWEAITELRLFQISTFCFLSIIIMRIYFCLYYLNNLLNYCLIKQPFVVWFPPNWGLNPALPLLVVNKHPAAGLILALFYFNAET